MICVPGPINGQVPSRPKTLPGGATLYISGNSTVPSSVVIKSDLRLMSPEAAIANLPVSAWAHMPTDIISVLGSIPGSNSLLRAILDGGMITRAGAAAGALRHIGRSADADRIISTISGLGHSIREEDPLSDQQNLPTFNSRKPLSAAGTRIKLLWSKMRDDVLAEFVEKPHRVTDVPKYLAEIDDRYVSDAYNSLSIEGYKVTAELIEKVKNRNWKPETDASDFETHNALAAQGYWLAFNEVKKDVKNILEGADVFYPSMGSSPRMVQGNVPALRNHWPTRSSYTRWIPQRKRLHHWVRTRPVFSRSRFRWNGCSVRLHCRGRRPTC